MEVELDDELYERLEVFKKIYDTVVEEEADFEEFVNCVVSFGLDKMLRDAIPEGEEWTTIQGMFKDNPEYITDFVSDVWKELKEGQEAKERTREEIEKTRKYIG
ncbi:hypothetical protein AKJ64_03880 [candidate division MSBL1 archaeon SCGC-AAA259E17]|uniref:Uncharacterized protein n=1 Tax=candidate division MSBL1 archaeon SCGC-AAA259E17 TaxID=1698263 RepID=A0A133UD94_9EURY|nr:hypothetical protein AKJ64_03880 [candidate division MSBL1 archaeon SCGC-AAA259E17]